MEYSTVSRFSSVDFPKEWKMLTESKKEELGPHSFRMEFGVKKVTLNLIALQLCEDCLIKGMTSDTPRPVPEVNDAQADILQYMAGAILHKLRCRYRRMDQQELSELLNTLIADGQKLSKLPGSLINIKTRGGLLTPIDDVRDLLILAYRKFKATKMRIVWSCYQEVVACGIPAESVLSD
ncbi:hypothetical protein CAPTEDRAFT_213562 [Capitella teleta]|uniref:Uncharacterized protein n=1 Tax=Capitella teleta TaxID=283909 RepID=R7VK01_CAPTE|nr:hypothetical protein CAPTEDRAFT_213562 [Capitella teleta]|eukprot:ELU16350.1 hypothetical protein CAPTEDRAFT_213562 [Capitella teleta]